MGARVSARDRLVIAPAERRRAVLDVIDAARERLLLSVFRCDDRRVIESLAAASRRGVRVEALLTRRAKGSRSSLRLLRLLFEQVGIRVRRSADARQKYHAKFLVADERISLVGSLNFTRRCFRKTFDVLAVSRDPALAWALAGVFAADCGEAPGTPGGALPARLIVGPEHARERLHGLIEGARRRVRIIDAKLTDPQMLGLLRARARAGVDVRLVTGDVAGMAAHGRLILLDDRTAIVGSLALAPKHLDVRREVALTVHDPDAVRPLAQLFEAAPRLESPRPRPLAAMESVA